MTLPPPPGAPPPPGFAPPPPRQRSRGCLITFLVIALVGLLAVTVGPAVFYYSWWKPREYLRSWSSDGSLGVGPYTFSVVTDHGDNKTYELGYATGCDNGCKDDLVGATFKFTQENHLGMTQADVVSCYKSGCVRWLPHEGHKMKIWFDPVVRGRYQFTITLYY